MIEFFFKKKLSMIQKIEFDKTVSSFKKDLKIFRQKDLKFLKAFKLSSILCFTVNTIFVQQGLFYF